MNRLAVPSTRISSVGYSPRICVLEIEFTDGTIYHYYSVPVDVYEGLMKADSYSAFFQERIENSFTYRKARSM